ncbi:HAD family hydrolase [Tropicibacter naphthalenivorans]|uniref:Fructose-1-phosphate phosphatase YqaB n=1 Tax=Tropicibacter naphthalenivorans TaxID=441103 RepID=A0A0P1G7J5_9RHOB|nr:HAD family phosphatase [Tropicibacter naphthalenivorans]CUH77653.1 Fructose-1-phosphate phosphatase YqaB [Tropicibacter naphthalenivorans]SMC54665.1 haloacid dehalogenase superfamily, subfamily IA, variant 3 with third motif having DD or ED [Tropicibacter naphthalenivorans]
MAKPALLFDLDGTMLNSDSIHMAVFADMMGSRGLNVTEDFYMQHVHGRLNVDFFAEFLPNEPDPQGLSDAKEAEFRARLPRPYPAMPGVAEVIAHAVDNDWPRAVVTNAMRLNAEAMLEAVGQRHAFEVMVIGEECPRGKPAPDPYLEAMRQLGVSPADCIAFEDSPSGTRAAAASGAFTVGIRSALSDRELRENGAHITIQDFNDPALREVFQRFDREANT